MQTSLNAITDTNTIAFIQLPYAFISVTGKDAEKFLQGQLTCDLSTLEDDKIQFSTTNTPKGRMYGLFKIARIENGFLLRLQASTLENFVAILSKYKVFYKCEINIEHDYQVFAYIAKEQSEHLPQNTNDLLRIEGSIVTCSSKQSLMFEIWGKNIVTPHLEINLSSEEWFALESQMGIPELYNETVNSFILQNLNLQDLGAVSFKKGCYTGQEIIARMKFLGKQKKKMFALHSDIKCTAIPGSDIFDSNAKKCGVIVRSHWSERTGSYALGILNTVFAETGEHVILNDETNTPFQVSELNYFK